MQNIIERIARFADIDTRRAMGFPPRRLPPSDLNIPMMFEDYTEFNQGRTRYYRLRNAELHVGLCEIAWVFGTDDFMLSRSYYFRRDDARVSFYSRLKFEHELHPDFNKDGSFKRSRPL